MSILNDIKKVLGVHADVDEFDLDLTMHINTALFQLMQLGVGPPGGLTITGPDEVWEQVTEGRQDLSAIKSYVAVVVRLLFDRPETSYGIQSLERMRDEFAWRLEIQRRAVVDDHSL